MTVTVTVTMTITVILEGREEEKRASKQANLRRVRGCEGARVRVCLCARVVLRCEGRRARRTIPTSR